MSLRSQVVVALVALAMFATAAIGLFAYRTTEQQSIEAVDTSLVETARRLGDGPSLREGPRPDRQSLRGAGDVVVQVIGPNGRVVLARGPDLPVDDIDLAVADGSLDPPVLRTVEIDDDSYRLLTVRDRGGQGAVQLARSLAETDAVLAALGRRIVAAAAVVLAGAVLLGWVIATGLTRRLARLTEAAEEVAATGDLDVTVPAGGNDETGRLSGAFATMLSALARSRADQQRLVEDAGHELRTPLTSLRTNVYTLRRADSLEPAERDRLIDDLEAETRELGRLVDEVVELATDRHRSEADQQLDLVALVRRVTTRASQRYGREVLVQAEPSTVLARPGALERAVGNLVENACKFDTTGGSIDVRVAEGGVEVADRGTGFEAEDLAHVFDRFHRSDAARSLPGSGLGLAIVAQIVAEHGGSVDAANRPGGGAVVSLRLPPERVVAAAR